MTRKQKYALSLEINEDLMLADTDNYPDYLTPEHMTELYGKYTPDEYLNMMLKGPLPYDVQENTPVIDVFDFAKWFAIDHTTF